LAVNKGKGLGSIVESIENRLVLLHSNFSLSFQDDRVEALDDKVGSIQLCVVELVRILWIWAGKVFSARWEDCLDGHDAGFDMVVNHECQQLQSSKVPANFFKDHPQLLGGV
jgi:hypothetical protein